MPDNWPEFPQGGQIGDYLELYAVTLGLSVVTSASVYSVKQGGSSGMWTVHLAHCDAVRVQAYDDDAHLVHDLDLDPAASGVSYHMVTGVREHDGTVWLGSLAHAAVAVTRL